MSAPATPWHARPLLQVCRDLGTHAHGLSRDEAARRRAADGPNEIEDESERARLRIPLDQVANLPSALLLGSSALCRGGDMVPAEARVIEAHRLSCDEGVLTGESGPQRKRSEPTRADAPLARRSSMLFAGTRVAAGHGRAVVVAIGRRTEVGGIRGVLERETAPQTPLQRQLDRLVGAAHLHDVRAARDRDAGAGRGGGGE